jgi:hypothetical protein
MLIVTILSKPIAEEHTPALSLSCEVFIVIGVYFGNLYEENLRQGKNQGPTCDVAMACSILHWYSITKLI